MTDKDKHEAALADSDAGAEQPAQENAPPAGAPIPTEIETLNARVREKEKELEELRDKYLRTLADAENARKRIRAQSEESVRIQREELLRDLLPVVDNLERALGAARGGGNGKSIVEGIEMVLGLMHDYLRCHGVSQVSSVGQPFDPLVHEAVDHVETEAEQPNTVMKEFNRGYKAGDRLLRPARVSVAKAPPPADKDGSGESQ